MALEFETVPDITDNPDVEMSRAALIGYIQWLMNFFERIAGYLDAREDDDIPYFDAELIGLFPPALGEVFEFREFQRVQGFVTAAPPGQLVAIGLTGRQLAMKLRTHNRWITVLGGARGRLARAAISRLLATINSLLKSILKVVPGGSALDELKEALENMRAIADEA